MWDIILEYQTLTEMYITDSLFSSFTHTYQYWFTGKKESYHSTQREGGRTKHSWERARVLYFLPPSRGG